MSEPSGGRGGHLLKGTGLLKEMGGIGDPDEMLDAGESEQGFLVPCHDRPILLTDDQQRRGEHTLGGASRQIGASPARDDGLDLADFGRGAKSGRRSRAGTKKPDA